MNTKEYLKHAVQIEMLLYEQKRVVADLKNAINNLKNYYYGGKEGKTTIIDSENIWTAMGALLGGAVFGCLGGFLASFLFPAKLTVTFDSWVRKRERAVNMEKIQKFSGSLFVL